MSVLKALGGGFLKALEAQTLSGMLVAVSIFYCLACSGRASAFGTRESA